MKLPKDTYSSERYNNLHFAVAHYGTGYHRQLWDLFVDAGFSKRQIFSKYMKILRDVSLVNDKILKNVGVRHFLFQMDEKSA